MGAVMIIGATSALARGAAEAFAAKGYPLYLAGRNVREMERLASDLRVRHQVEVKCGWFDADERQKHAQVVQQAVREMDELQGALIAFGDLGDHEKALFDRTELEKVIGRNFIGACTLLHELSSYFASKESGFLIAVSSVAGERGRQSNYVYGAAKGGLSLFMGGLRNRLYPLGVRVITIIPGFIDSAMTFGKKGIFLAISPQEAGKRIVASLSGSKDIVYIPWFWRYIMWVIKAIPENLFKRMRL